MSKTEYARHRGVSRQTVYEWIRKNEIVMSGSKVDVVATESQQKLPKTEREERAYLGHRTLEMTWGDFWKAVRVEDGKHPAPVTEDEIRQRVEAAAEELGWSVEFLYEEQGFYLSDDYTECYFQQNTLLENAWAAIGFLRRDACYAAHECPDDLDDWSPEGIKALSLWDKTVDAG